RAANPAAARRARGILKAMDEAEAAAAAQDTARQQATANARRELAHLVAEVEALASAASSGDAALRLDGLVAQWNAGASNADAALAERFATAVAGARDALSRARAARQEADRAAEALEASLGVR